MQIAALNFFPVEAAKLLILRKLNRHAQ